MKIGIVGATGLVGRKLLKLLEDSILPISELRLIASSKSSGKTLSFRNHNLTVHEISHEILEHLDLVFFMASKSVAREFAPIAVKLGAVVIDNSSEFRMQEDIPLVVPEVNFNILTKEKRLIANPNCSTIQLMVPLKCLDEVYTIKRVDVSTYQAVSGSGKEAIDEYYYQIKNYFEKRKDPTVLPVKSLKNHFEIIDNAIPQIDQFEDTGYTKEEMKVVNESRKILKNEFQVCCTAVRVPVINGHSESVSVTFSKEINIDKVMEAFRKEDNLIIMDSNEEQIYPLASFCSGRSEVFVGRIRKDLFANNILHFWVVADNLLKGAASNALQIALKCYEERVYGW